MEKKVIAIDCGGTFIKLGLINEKGEIEQQNSFATDAKKGVNNVLANLEKHIAEFKKQNARAIGIAYAGPLDSEKGIIIDPPNFPKDWHNLPLVDILQKKTGLPVVMENDANLAALGEYWQGAGQNTTVLVVLTLGTGIGGGIIIDGKIWNGMTGIAGEIGHIPLEEPGVLCGCGSKGCLETVASCNAVLRMAKESKLPFSTAEMVYDAAVEGNQQARAIYVIVGKALGKAIVAVTHILGPEKFVLTGGGAGAWEFFYPELIKIFYDKSFIKEQERTSIVPAKLAGQSGMIGAAYLACKKAKFLHMDKFSSQNKVAIHRRWVYDGIYGASQNP